MKTFTFKIGRGGRFYNAGHKKLIGYNESLQDYFQDVFLIDGADDDEDEKLPEEEWLLLDANGNTLLKGYEIMSRTGTLDFDGDYDTIIVRSIEELREDEKSIVLDSYETFDKDYQKAISNYIKN